jgi:hypothetical protein
MRGGAHSEPFEHFEARARCVQTELRALAAGEIDERLDGRLEQVQRRFGVAEVGREVEGGRWNRVAHGLFGPVVVCSSSRTTPC